MSRAPRRRDIDMPAAWPDGLARSRGTAFDEAYLVRRQVRRAVPEVPEPKEVNEPPDRPMRLPGLEPRLLDAAGRATVSLARRA